MHFENSNCKNSNFIRRTYHSVEGDLERTNSWNDFVASVFLVIVGNQLAVDVGHGPHFWHHVENHITVWITLLDSGGH